MDTQTRNERIVASLKAFNPGVTDFSHDNGLPTKAVGHASGLATSTAISRSYRNDHRPGSQFVEPQQVIEVLRAARINKWVLMGLYGYVGYLASPRATQDVDILIATEECEPAIEGIRRRWPKLIVDREAVVIRFRDPGEVAIDGETKQVIDLMLPSNECYSAILEKYHCIDPSSGYPIPLLEAAMASKYAALVSPYRQWIRKQQDAVDLRTIIMPNPNRINRELAVEIADLVFQGGGAELLEFIDLAINNQPFPI
jgi:hypothetical protein